MNALERLKRWRGLSVLRGRLKSAPSAASYAELAERLISLAEHDEAFSVADKGLSLYPDSDRLAHARLYVMKARLAGKIRNLKDDMRRRPHPGAYAQLAEVHRELGAEEDALAVAAECAERFPLHEAAFVVQGDIRLERFRDDMIARDAVLAEAALRQVLKLNSQNADAHRRLAELYWLVGMLPACRAHLAQFQLLAPGDTLLEALAVSLERRTPAPPAREGFEELAGNVQERRAFANDDTPFRRTAGARAPARATVDHVSAGAAMQSLAGRAGLRNAALFTAEGTIVAAVRGADGLAPEAFADLVEGLRKAADDASRNMDTGSLLRTEIESPSGNVLLATTRGFTVAVFYRSPLAPASAMALVQDFTTRQLGAGQETARA